VIDNDLSRSIRALSDPDSHARETAAAEIFASGCELARPIVEQWSADDELASCFVRGASGVPEQTVGVAVEADNFERLRKAFGFPPLADVPPDQDALEFEIDYPSGVRLDILTTRDPSGSGAIAGFLRKFGDSRRQRGQFRANPLRPLRNRAGLPGHSRRRKRHPREFLSRSVTRRRQSADRTGGSESAAARPVINWTAFSSQSLATLRRWLTS
jgi:hypothetical protein